MTTAAISGVSKQQSYVDPTQATQNSSGKLAKTLVKILQISAIALAAIAGLAVVGGGIAALTIFFPHVMYPILYIGTFVLLIIAGLAAHG